MTAFIEFFCDYCNPSCQRRDPGDEVNTGYSRVPSNYGMPSRWFGLPGGGHACGRCRKSREALEVAQPTPDAPAEAPPPARVVPSREWPAITSPFGASDSTAPSRVGGADDTGVRADGE